MRRAAQLVVLPETTFQEAIRNVGTKSVRFACVLRGWSQSRIALWEELSRLGPEPRPETQHFIDTWPAEMPIRGLCIPE